jgi:tRNA-specific 2-thiouridylase
VLAALSGGVDSSVAAAVLVEQGHEVVGATMRLWAGASDTGCCAVSDVEDARRSAAQIGIDHHVFDWTEDFQRLVVDPYVQDHAAGRTPNPCVECNRHLKFDRFLARAGLLGFDAVATGHHARVVRRGGRAPRIARGADRAKDQSYVLHPLCGTDLGRVLLPVGEMTKAEVRSRAAALGLRTAAKPDSQDVCFVTRAEGRAAFLGERISLHPATVLDAEGSSVGRVDAVELVTTGQRRGLGLAGGGDRRFVTDVDVAARVVTVGPPEQLLCDEAVLEGVRWADGPFEGDVLAQCSAHGEAAPGRVVPGPAGTAALRWERPRRRVAPGQSVVLYDGDEVVAGACAG